MLVKKSHPRGLTHQGLTGKTPSGFSSFLSGLMFIECSMLAVFSGIDNSPIKMPLTFTSSVFFAISSNQNGKNSQEN